VQPPGSPTLVGTVNGKTGGPVYTTRDLLVRAHLSAGAFYTVNSFDVTRLRHLPHPDGDEAPPGEAYGIADWPLGAEVDARPMGGREVPAFVKVTITLPRGVPTLHYSLGKTPIGVGVKVLQDGAAVAQVRMAGRCDPTGQFSPCRFKQLSTAL
jgi:hypothetical protein